MVAEVVSPGGQAREQTAPSSNLTHRRQLQNPLSSQGRYFVVCFCVSRRPPGPGRGSCGSDLWAVPSPASVEVEGAGRSVLGGWTFGAGASARLGCPPCGLASVLGQTPEEGAGGGSGSAAGPGPQSSVPHPGTPSPLAASTSLFRFFTSKRSVWMEYAPGGRCSRLTSTKARKVANLLVRRQKLDVRSLISST